MGNMERKRKNKVIQKLKKSKYSPLNLFDKEERRTMYEASHGEKKIFLTKDQALIIFIMAATSAFIIAFTKFMIFARWSTFPDNSYFCSWHPITPWIIIGGVFLYVAACWSKGITYWLPYVPAAFSLLYCIIEIFMIEAWLPPQALQPFFSWLAEFDWMIGRPLP